MTEINNLITENLITEIKPKKKKIWHISIEEKRKYHNNYYKECKDTLCECGKFTNTYTKARHLKSDFHKKRVKII